MNAVTSLGAPLALALAAVAAPVPDARQYYVKYWQQNGGYYYRAYHYRPKPDSAYRLNLVIFYPSRPRYYYYYNPRTKKYWGRFDRREGGFSALPPDKAAGRISELPEDAFPGPGAMPVLPGSADGTRMKVPPDGFPPDDDLTLSEGSARELVHGKGDREPPRQFYTDWCKRGGYYYRSFFCRPRPGGDYAAHRCVYYPDRPKYLFYYDPAKQAYWGRFDRGAGGFAPLPESERRGRLSEIPEGAFPKPGEMPVLPGSDDGTRMDRPPKGLPA